MALPSAKRPKEVEKDFLQRLESLKREKELLESSNTNKPEIFQNVMSDWFKALPKSRQARVTPKELKLKALRVCQSWEVVYERLPLDWVQRLQSECNMKLYVKRKKVRCCWTFATIYFVRLNLLHKLSDLIAVGFEKDEAGQVEITERNKFC